MSVSMFTIKQLRLFDVPQSTRKKPIQDFSYEIFQQFLIYYKDKKVNFFIPNLYINLE